MSANIFKKLIFWCLFRNDWHWTYRQQCLLFFVFKPTFYLSGTKFFRRKKANFFYYSPGLTTVETTNFPQFLHRLLPISTFFTIFPHSDYSTFNIEDVSRYFTGAPLLICTIKIAHNDWYVKAKRAFMLACKTFLISGYWFLSSQIFFFISVPFLSTKEEILIPRNRDYCNRQQICWHFNWAEFSI